MNQVFPITPAAGGVFWVLGPVGLIMLIVLALFAYISFSTTHVRFEVSPDGLQIRGDLYGRLVPASSLVPAEAKEINLRSDAAHRLAMRTNGVGLPGYMSGWFRLGNGEKALVFVTDTSHAVYVPTLEGYSVIVSPADPEAFIASLQNPSAAR